MFNFLGFTEIIIILALALILFGPDKLQDISRSLGNSVGKFKETMDGFEEIDKDLKESLDFTKDIEEASK